MKNHVVSSYVSRKSIARDVMTTGETTCDDRLSCQCDGGGVPGPTLSLVMIQIDTNGRRRLDDCGASVADWTGNCDATRGMIINCPADAGTTGEKA